MTRLLSYLLLPFSCLYGLVTWCRNRMFDCGVLAVRRYAEPVICVGNLAVGGTGKTPHAEYLLRLLLPTRRVAVVSRGYRRQTKGFQMAGANTTAAEIGDEPMQIHAKFPAAQVAVCERRSVAIDRLLEAPEDERPEVFLLDDAYQHRHVQAGLYILLTDYHRLMSRDWILPAGRLRESWAGRRRAQVVIVTKCPPQLSESERQDIAKELKLKPEQHLFFTTQAYADLHAVFGAERLAAADLAKAPHILLVTGIAHPETLIAHVRSLTTVSVQLLRYPDHHAFSTDDQQRLNDAFRQAQATAGQLPLVITTEKDAARLALCQDLAPELRQRCYAMPVEVRFLANQAETFNQIILNYAEKN